MCYNIGVFSQLDQLELDPFGAVARSHFDAVAEVQSVVLGAAED